MEKKTAEKIVNVKIEEEIKSSYLDYAMSVIVGRALPDVRDGLKPVHRRILYAMHDLNLTPDKPYRKSAKIAGDTTGNYHPHGDVAVYDAMVRMAQDFSMRYPLIDGHGNFGSIDGDPPAAMRYTEVRMSPFAVEMLADIEKETVDFVPNYDGTRKEPVVLPSKIPQLLMNGSSGIAVGMATNIPPHNLGELVDALIFLIDEPDADILEIMKFLPGPDFPTGGFIWGREGIIEAYKTGRGTITLQARWNFEESDEGKDQIVITELPYQVNKANLLEKIAELVKNKVITGISEIRDESDRTGMRIVLELKRDALNKVVMNQLLAHTQLRTTFGIIMLALVDGRPEVLNIKDMLVHYLNHRKEVVTRRSRYELKIAQERAHILEGLKKALDNLDEIIKIIRRSETVEIAKESLMKNFKLTEVQAQAILDMQLRRLAGLERKKIDQEYKELIKKIAYLQDVLSHERKIYQIIKEELQQIKEKYADERRTEIREKEAKDLTIEDLIPQEDMVVVITRGGYIKRMPLSSYRSQQRGGKGITGLTIKEEDIVSHLFVATTHHYILFFTEKGKVYRLKAYEVPQASRQAKGTPIVNLLPLEKGEEITACVSAKDFKKGEYLFMATKQGIVKKTELEEFANISKAGKIALTLDENDRLLWVKQTDGKKEIILATQKGQCIRFKEEEVRPMGRTARGVIGVRLSKGDSVVGMDILEKDKELLSISSLGYGKRTPLSQFRLQKRGGSGIKAMKIGKKNGDLVSVKVVDKDDEVLIISSDGVIIRTPVKDISQQGRNTQGVKVIRLEENAKVVAVEIIEKEK